VRARTWLRLRCARQRRCLGLCVCVHDQPSFHRPGGCGLSRGDRVGRS
jgi:hypothetical protein